MIRAIIAVAIAAALLSLPASAQIMMMGVGPGSFTGGVAPVNCGTGVIDLSTGCVQPMLRGL